MSGKIKLTSEDIKGLFSLAVKNGTLYEFGIIALDWIGQASAYISQVHDCERTFLLLNKLRREKQLYVSKHHGVVTDGYSISTWVLTGGVDCGEYTGRGKTDLEALTKIAEQVGINMETIDDEMVQMKKFQVASMESIGR